MPQTEKSATVEFDGGLRLCYKEIKHQKGSRETCIILRDGSKVRTVARSVKQADTFAADLIARLEGENNDGR